MKFSYVVIVAFCSFAIAACAPMQPKLQELQVQPERIIQNGYSLVPMNEAGWVVAGRNQYQLVLVKAGSNPDETIAIQAMLFELPEFKSTEEFVRLTKDGQAKDTDLQRFVIKKHEVVAYPKMRSNCTKAHIVTEDKAAVKRSGKSGSMILEALTLTCAHPKDKKVGVNVTYSHRYYPEQGDEAFIEKATSVLDSVEFIESFASVGSADDPSKGAQPGWIASEPSGCLLWNFVPCAGESVAWKGPCQENRANGRGEYTWRCGAAQQHYVGEMRDGAPNGRGILEDDNGRYEGDYVNGRENGRGSMVWKANGARYVGDFVQGEPTGRGKMSKANGDWYDGQWKDGLSDGHGEAQIAGEAFKGTWVRNCLRSTKQRAAWDMPITRCPKVDTDHNADQTSHGPQGVHIE